MSDMHPAHDLWYLRHNVVTLGDVERKLDEYADEIERLRAALTEIRIEAAGDIENCKTIHALAVAAMEPSVCVTSAGEGTDK